MQNLNEKWETLAIFNVFITGIHEIVDLSTKGQYQIACTKYYEATHAQPPSSIINHPNQYFQDSMGASKEKDDAGKKVNKSTLDPSQPETSSN